MNWKNVVRIFVLAGIVGWPGYEYYQYRQAKGDLAASVVLKNSVETKLSAARVKYAQANVPSANPVQ